MHTSTNRRVLRNIFLNWGGGVKEVLKRKHCRTRVWIRPGQLPDTLISASGNFFCQEEDVTSIRQQLLLLDIVPKITLKDESRIKSMSYKRCRIEVLPPNWQQIDQWCSKLGVVYSGQSLPTASFEVLSSLIKELNVRETLSGQEKQHLGTLRAQMRALRSQGQTF